MIHGQAAGSEGRTGLLQEFGLFGGTFPPQNGVAVRITAKTVYNGLVFQLKLIGGFAGMLRK